MQLVKAAQLFKAFGDRTRLRILSLLRTRPLTGTQLATILRVPRARITRHLAYLGRSGLLTVRHEYNEAYYLLRPAVDPLHRRLIEAMIPQLTSVVGLAKDAERMRKGLGSKQSEK
jgi:ArsR family transcriptional regulator, arsenate/arsenite/antimonite-responsive transcriptional repressor